MSITRLVWSIKHRAKQALRWGLAHSGPLPLAAKRFAHSTGIVLAFHTVDERSVAIYPENVLTPDQFRRTVARVLRSGLPVVPLHDLVTDLKAGPPRPCVALTFDDGYRGCLEHAAPILLEHEMPATFFVSPGFVDREDAKWDDLLYLGRPTRDKRILRRPRAEVDRAVAEVVARAESGLRERCAAELMSYAEIRELRDLGFSIQSHGLRHYYLSAQAAELQSVEIGQSKLRLEEELGARVDFLAYPFGFPGCFDATSKGLARDTGYSAAFTLEDRYASEASDRFEIPRFGISRSTPDWHLELILSGLFF